MLRTVAVLLCLATPAAADSLCGVVGDADLLVRLEGTWGGEARRSLVNEVLDRSGVSGEMEVRIEDGRLSGPLIEDLRPDPLPLSVATAPLYDVDDVDGVLETTGHEVLADLLSDTPCGPERVPQIVARIDEGNATVVRGTITLLAYFDDRLLRIVELELQGGGAILFLTETALLSRAP